ncbi:hypothetical protein [Candidatus Ruthturnera calyptogenae]|nr:hypothetical protein [Candidatus Ruthturnera calyptogenae]
MSISLKNSQAFNKLSGKKFYLKHLSIEYKLLLKIAKDLVEVNVLL